MKDQLKARLNELKTEFEAGRTMLADLETRKSDLEQKLLRISGAVQVIEEELEKAHPTSTPDETER